MQGKTLPEYWQSFKKQAEQRRDRGNPEFPTGFKFLDTHTDGLHGGEVWCISGKSGSGKTSLALQIGRNIADNPNNSVLFISLEMKGEQLVGRLFCEMMHEDFTDLRLGNFSYNFADKEKTFLKAMGGMDLEIVEHGYTFQEIEQIIKEYYSDKKPDVIVIDFAQLIAWEKFGDQRVALESYIRKLTELAKTLNLAIILISQLRRMPSGSDYNRPPDMTDLKGTGSLEQLSHTVLLIYKYIEDGAEHYRLKIAKNRHGATDEREVAFIGSQYRFVEVI